MLNVLTTFVGELRSAGVPVSLTETVDALEALQYVALEDRNLLRYSLGTTLVKSDPHRVIFETMFDLYFPPRPADEPDQSRGDEALGSTSARPTGRSRYRHISHAELADALLDALMINDSSAVESIAREAVFRFSTIEPDRPLTGRYYVFRTLRSLEVDELPDRLVTAARIATPSMSELEERLAREEFIERVASLRRAVEAEVRFRMLAAQGPEARALAVRRPLPEDVDFMRASDDELEAMRAIIQPLTRRLAVRLMQRRRHQRRGPLDFRATLRHSLSYGGAMAELRFRDHKPPKPEIMVVADMSGSVAAFARFTLMLLHAVHDRFARVRTFVFVDAIDEVTRLFEQEQTLTGIVARINREADMVRTDGHSDYGRALEGLWRQWGRDVGSRTTVLMLGDARNNHHLSQAWVLGEMSKRARHVFWLNPEPRAQWNSGDSIMREYARHCDGVFECRNVRQLERFVEQLV